MIPRANALRAASTPSMLRATAAPSLVRFSSSVTPKWMEPNSAAAKEFVEHRHEAYEHAGSMYMNAVDEVC